MSGPESRWSHACAFVFLSLAGLALGVYSPQRIYDPPPPVPGTCNNSLQCGLGWICGRYQFCTPLDGTRFAPARQWDVEKEDHGIIEDDGEGRIVILFAGLFLVVTVIFFHVTMCKLRAGRGQCVTVVLSWFLGAVALVALIFMSLRSVERLPKLYPPQTNGTFCDFPTDVACMPYRCDVLTNQCFEHCSNDLDCAAERMTCCEGVCQFTRDSFKISSPGPGVNHAHPDILPRTPGSGAYDDGPFQTALIGFLSLALCLYLSFFFGFILAHVQSFTCARYLPGKNLCVRTTFFAAPFLLLCSLLLLITGFTLYDSIDVDSNVAVSSVTCVSHAQCYPYGCDILRNVNADTEVSPSRGTLFVEGLCRTHCVGDYHCVEGYVCSGGLCHRDRSYPREYSSGLPGARDGVALAFVMLFLLPLVLATVNMFTNDIFRTKCGCPRTVTISRRVCRIWVYFTLALALFLFLLVPLGGVTEERVWDGEVTTADGAACTAVNAQVCEPYTCDVQVGRCHTECVTDGQCALGTACDPTVSATSLTSTRRTSSSSTRSSSSSTSSRSTHKRNLQADSSGTPKKCAYHPGSPAHTRPLRRSLSVSMAIAGGLWAGAILVVVMVALRRFCGSMSVRNPYAGLRALDALPEEARQRHCAQDSREPLIWFLAICLLVTCFALINPLVFSEIQSNDFDTFSHSGATCVTDLASACYPYVCDNHAQQCLNECKNDTQCWEGSLCMEGKCIGLPTRTVARGLAVPAIVLLFGLVAMLAAMTTTICWWDADWQRHADEPCVGICQTDALLWCLLAVTIPVTAASMGGAYFAFGDYQYMHQPPGSGTGLACQSVEAFQCDPLYCDMSLNKCHEKCVVDADCRPSFLCSAAGQCTRSSLLDHPGALTSLILISVACWFTPLFFGAILPRTSCMRRLAMRARLEHEAQERGPTGCCWWCGMGPAAVQQERQRRRTLQRRAEEAEARRDHGLVLDIMPPNVTGEDRSLPTPPAAAAAGSRDLPGGAARAKTTNIHEDETPPAYDSLGIGALQKNGRSIGRNRGSRSPAGGDARVVFPEREPETPTSAHSSNDASRDHWRCHCAARNPAAADRCARCQRMRYAAETPVSARDMSIVPMGQVLAHSRHYNGTAAANDFPPVLSIAPIPAISAASSTNNSPTARRSGTPELGAGRSTRVAVASEPPGENAFGDLRRMVAASASQRSLPAASAGAGVATTGDVELRPVEGRRGGEARQTTERECCVCMSEPSTVRMVGRLCKHGFCGECARRTLETALTEGQFPACCPGCRAEAPDPPEGSPISEAIEASYIPADVIEHLAYRMIITAEFAKRFICMQLLQAFGPSEAVTCPICGMLCATPDLHAKTGSDDPDHLEATCPECELSFCVRCLNMWHAHKGLTCSEAESARSARHDAAYIATFAKQCPGCGMGIIHYRGHACHHIRPGTGCPNCHRHFCYVCLGPWPCHSPSHGTYCDARCDCQTCPDCKPGRPCPHCPGGAGCPSCQGTAPAKAPAKAAPAPPAAHAGANANANAHANLSPAALVAMGIYRPTHYVPAPTAAPMPAAKKTPVAKSVPTLSATAPAAAATTSTTTTAPTPALPPTIVVEPATPSVPRAERAVMQEEPEAPSPAASISPRDSSFNTASPAAVTPVAASTSLAPGELDLVLHFDSSDIDSHSEDDSAHS